MKKSSFSKGVGGGLSQLSLPGLENVAKASVSVAQPAGDLPPGDFFSSDPGEHTVQKTTAPSEKSSFHHFGGVDENGLGPKLGPLVVTGVLASVDDERAALEVIGPAKDELSKLIGDSKKLVGFGHSALGEAWARVLLERSGVQCTCPSEVVSHIAIRAPETTPTECPKAMFSLCFRPKRGEDDVFEASDDVMKRVKEACDSLDQRGIHLRLAATSIVCNRTLNESKARGIGRFDVDLHCMERLFFHMLGVCGSNLTVHCGKVGGLTFYGSHFTAFRPDPTKRPFESRELSVYESGTSQMRFVLDAEPKHQLVALASLVGKWLRDLSMNRLLSHLRDGHPEWPIASGYNDPTTKKLILLSEEFRRAQNIPDQCFLRF